MKIFFSAVLIFCLVFISAGQTSPPVVKTPEAAAQGLFQAWKIKNKKTARKFARAEAIDKLFSTRWRAMKFKGCAKREAEDGGGGYECIYEDAKIDLSIAMIVKNFRVGYKITEISFSSEAI